MNDDNLHVKSIILTRYDLEKFLINCVGMPKDIVVTNIDREGSQEAWRINVAVRSV